MHTLFHLFDSITPLSPDLRTHLQSLLRTTEFKKKSTILDTGHIANRIYFIEKGLVRSVRHEKGKERTAWFMQEGDIIISVESFFKQEPSLETIEALEPCLTHSISRDQLYNTYTRFPEFNLHRAVILEKYYAESEARARIKQMKAKDKFQHLLHTQPNLVNRASDKMLASYLGITPGTYSLQKNKLANKTIKV
jgi:CRP-like cAMP-binding protein